MSSETTPLATFLRPAASDWRAIDWHEYARRIPDAQVVIFPDTGHIPMVEQPERFNATLLEFIGASGDERGA